MGGKDKWFCETSLGMSILGCNVKCFSCFGEWLKMFEKTGLIQVWRKISGGVYTN